eukprot:1307406-Pleurochrysis_carterae.AAC.1
MYHSTQKSKACEESTVSESERNVHVPHSKGNKTARVIALKGSEVRYPALQGKIHSKTERVESQFRRAPNTRKSRESGRQTNLVEAPQSPQKRAQPRGGKPKVRKGSKGSKNRWSDGDGGGREKTEELEGAGGVFARGSVATVNA